MPKRRRGSRTGRCRPRPAGRHVPFADLVGAAIASIPMPFAAALEEVAIVIADEPAPDQLEPGEDSLYGLYEGIPRSEWGADWAPVPNRILVFRLPLEADFADPEDLADEVWMTIVHELAHHLGIDDARLEELGVD
jgi:predicted Zn-dependent protease with MMP-like domain